MENAASEKHVKKKASRDERLRHQDKEDIRFVMSTVQGRRLMQRIFDFCGDGKSPEDNSGSWVYYKVGRATVPLWLRAEIDEVDIKLRHQMELEKKDYENV